MKLKTKGYTWKKLDELYSSTPDPATGQANEMFPGFCGLWCKIIMSVTAFATTENSIALIYGPLNCNWAIRNFKTTDYALYYGNAFIHMPTVKLDQNAVIFGGIENLKEGIRQADKHYSPSIIGVFDSCAPALIGEDIVTAIESVKSECQAIIKYFPSAGLAAPWLGKSIDEVSSEYVNMMENYDTIPDTVNILGQYKEKFCTRAQKKQCDMYHYRDEATELGLYIEALGLKLHRVMINGGPKYIRTATQAGVNMISCPTWGYPLAIAMKNKFDIPFGKHCIPMGFESTRKWIMELGRLTNRLDRAEEYIEIRRKELNPLIEQVKEICNGKIALIECGRNTQTSFARAMALGRLCVEIGMKPYFFNAHPLEIKAKKNDVEYFLSDNFNPEILFGPYPYQKPVNITDVIQDLNIEADDFIYFTEDVFPFAKAGTLDVSNISKVESAVHLRRIKNATGRGMGFSGAESIMNQIIASIKTSKRNCKPTLYSRINGKFYEFE